MKTGEQLFNKTFEVTKDRDTSEFSKYVRLTSELIKRPYMQTFKLVEDWQLHFIIRGYNECKEYKGEIPKDVLWWYLRKKDNNN